MGITGKRLGALQMETHLVQRLTPKTVLHEVGTLPGAFQEEQGVRGGWQSRGWGGWQGPWSRTALRAIVRTLVFPGYWDDLI